VIIFAIHYKHGRCSSVILCIVDSASHWCECKHAIKGPDVIHEESANSIMLMVHIMQKLRKAFVRRKDNPTLQATHWEPRNHRFSVLRYPLLIPHHCTALLTKVCWTPNIEIFRFLVSYKATISIDNNFYMPKCTQNDNNIPESAISINSSASSSALLVSKSTTTRIVMLYKIDKQRYRQAHKWINIEGNQPEDDEISDWFALVSHPFGTEIGWTPLPTHKENN